jgi:hypothetical protein
MRVHGARAIPPAERVVPAWTTSAGRAWKPEAIARGHERSLVRVRVAHHFTSEARRRNHIGPPSWYFFRGRSPREALGQVEAAQGVGANEVDRLRDADAVEVDDLERVTAVAVTTFLERLPPAMAADLRVLVDSAE